MKMTSRISAIILSLTLMAGCVMNVSSYSIQEEDEEMNEMIGEQRTEAELEILRNWALETSREGRGRYIIDYILRSNLAPANNDVDMRTIERFVYYDGVFDFGHGFVLDRMHGRVYYEPNSRNIHHINAIRYSADFIEEDLERLIQAIEESGLRNWQEVYRGELVEGATGGGNTWAIGILFSDGTVMRRRGSGEFNAPDGLPPLDQWAILTNFINTIGAEIQERHNAEASQSE